MDSCRQQGSVVLPVLFFFFSSPLGVRLKYACGFGALAAKCVPGALYKLADRQETFPPAVQTFCVLGAASQKTVVLNGTHNVSEGLH